MKSLLNRSTSKIRANRGNGLVEPLDTRPIRSWLRVLTRFHHLKTRLGHETQTIVAWQSAESLRQTVCVLSNFSWFLMKLACLSDNMQNCFFNSIDNFPSIKWKLMEPAYGDGCRQFICNYSINDNEIIWNELLFAMGLQMCSFVLIALSIEGDG